MEQVDFSRHQFGLYTFEGVSRAGIGTCIRVPELGICFDVAQGYLWAAPSELFLITHGHMDHAGGIPYIISQRALNDLNPGKFLMPQALVAPIQEVLSLWSKIEGHEYRYELVGVKPGEIYNFKNHLDIEVFSTEHRVPSQGYIVNSRKKKLKPEFRKLNSEMLAAKRLCGEILDEEVIEPLIAFTGDTQIEFMKTSPQALKAKILVVEVTYFGSKKSVAAAREWGHIHFDELVPLLDMIESEKIVLIHASRRHSRHEIQKAILNQVSVEHQKRLLLF